MQTINSPKEDSKPNEEFTPATGQKLTIFNLQPGSKYDGEPTPDEMQKWKSYLGLSPDQSQLSSDHRIRLEFTRMFHQFEFYGASLFHMTITYKSYQGYEYSPKNTNDFFVNFYLKDFLPNLLKTKNIHKRRHVQPICYAFLDEHESVPKKMTKDYMFPVRLHHHAILAVQYCVGLQMVRMLGENMIAFSTKYSSKVMTTYLRECDPMVALYATKRLRKYPEYLVFPDRLH
jgi:hypothetical protein